MQKFEALLVECVCVCVQHFIKKKKKPYNCGFGSVSEGSRRWGWMVNVPAKFPRFNQLAMSCGKRCVISSSLLHGLSLSPFAPASLSPIFLSIDPLDWP